jgi:hypothetical protein
VSPGAFIAAGVWGLVVAWLAWEVWRAPELDEPEDEQRLLELIWLEQCWEAEPYDWRRR